jgi:undecaprenyl-diphosphatase
MGDGGHVTRWSTVRDQLRRLGREWNAFTIILVLAAAAWSFIELTDEVIEGDARPIDRTLLLALRAPGDTSDPLGPLWLEEMMRDFTALGGIGVLTLITLATVGYAVLVGRRRLAVTVVVAVLGGIVLSTAIKAGIDRPRPDLVSHGSYVTSASFPSGHSMMAATVYLTLAALLVRFRSDRRSKAYVLAVALVVTVLVGVSRVYLGVHWPTDVLAGWTVGAAWALLVSTIAAQLQRRGALDRGERAPRRRASYR